MADYKIVTIKNGKPTNLATGDTAEAPQLKAGTLLLGGGSITDSSGTINFNDENLTTTGVITGGASVFASGTTIGTLTLGNGSITDSSGAISFGNEDLSTTGTLGAGVATLATGSAIGNLTLGNGSITDSSGAISFGDENLSTTGTLGAGVATLATGSTIGTLTLADGSITDSSGAIDFGDETLTTTGTLNAGAINATSGNIVGQGSLTVASGTVNAQSLAITAGGSIGTTLSVNTMTLATGSITDSTGAISFGDETLTTTGTLNAGAINATSGNIVGQGSLTVASGTVNAQSLAITAGGSIGTTLTVGTDLTVSGTSTHTGLASFGADVDITGDLTVGGAIVSRGAFDIVVQDQFLELGNGNVSTGAVAGGYTQVNAKSGGVTYHAASFTASSNTITLTADGTDATSTHDSGSIEITTLFASSGGNNPQIEIQDAGGNPVAFVFSVGWSGSTIAEQTNSLATAINANANFAATSNGVDTVIVQLATNTSNASSSITVSTPGGSTGAATVQALSATPRIPANSIVMISGLTTAGENNGLFAVASTGAGTIVLATSVTAPIQFCQTAIQDATEAATVVFVKLYVQAASDGALTDSTGAAIAAGTLADSFQEFASLANFTNGYSIVGASSTSLQVAYDNGSQINNNNTGTPFQVSGDGSITLSSNANGPVQNVGQTNQTGSVTITGNAAGGNNSSVSILSRNDMAISMVSDLNAEASLTIGAYTPSGSQTNTLNTVAIKGDEVSLISNFIAGEAIGARAALAFGTMVQNSAITVGAGALAANESIDFTIGASNFTITFTAAGGIDTSFSGTVPNRTANVEFTGLNEDQLASAVATLINSETNMSSAVGSGASSNVVTTTPTAGGTNSTNMALSLFNFSDNTSNNVFTYNAVQSQGVVVQANSFVQSSAGGSLGFQFAGIHKSGSAANQGDGVEVEFVGIVSCNSLNGVDLYAGQPVYMNGNDGSTNNSGRITGVPNSVTNTVIYQVGILMETPTSNVAQVLIQPQFIAEIN